MMRVILVSLVVAALAGCLDMPTYDFDEARAYPAPDVRIAHPLRMTEATAQATELAEGRILLDEIRSVHGTYRLVFDDQGLWCGASAGPDAGAIGIVNTCRISEASVVAEKQTFTHDFEVLMIDTLPKTFTWDLAVDLVYEQGNTTVTRHHDAIHRLEDVSPSVQSTLELDLSDACDWPDELESSQAGPRHPLATFRVDAINGWPYVELPLHQAKIAAVETNGEWRLDGGLLRIDGVMGTPLNGTIWLDPEAQPLAPQGPNACASLAALGYHEEPIELRRGATGLVEGWSAEKVETGKLPVWLVV